MIDPAKIARIAEKLTVAQREWILAMPSIPVSLSPTDWDAIPQLYVTLDELNPVDGYCGEVAFFGAAHAHKPVGTEWYLSAWLNETGQVVAQHLKEQPHD